MVDDFEKSYRSMSNDGWVNVWHLTLFVALLFLWKRNNFKNPVAVTRRAVMTLAHVQSIATYHKCIKELQQFGYILYVPSYNPYTGSFITILVV